MNVKKNIALVVILTHIVLLTSCANYYSIIKEHPKNPLLLKYNNLYIGWLDFGEYNWEKFGYSSPDQWSTTVGEMNRLGLHTYLLEFLAGKKIYGSTTPIDSFQAYSGLYIKFSYAVISNRADYLVLIIKFIDIEDQKVVYQVQVKIENKRSGFQPPFSGFNDMSVEGRLDNLVYNLAWFISLKLNEFPQ